MRLTTHNTQYRYYYSNTDPTLNPPLMIAFQTTCPDIPVIRATLLLTDVAMTRSCIPRQND